MGLNDGVVIIQPVFIISLHLLKVEKYSQEKFRFVHVYTSNVEK